MNELLKSLSLQKGMFSLRKNRRGIRGLFSTRSYVKGEEIIRLPIYESPARILERNPNINTFIEYSTTFNTLSRNGQFAALLSMSIKNRELYAYWNLIHLTKKDLSWNIWFWSKQTLAEHSSKSSSAQEYYSNYLQKLRNDYITFGTLYDEYTSKNGKMVYNIKRETFQNKCMLYRIIISARGFGMNNGKNALVPLLDLMNHGSLKTYNIDWKFLDNVFVMSARKNIKKNSELLDSYGHTKTSYQFLSLYGFIPT